MQLQIIINLKIYIIIYYKLIYDILLHIIWWRKMEKESFKQLLKKADFNKRTFSQYLGLKYQSVNSWGNNGRNVPYWVESWLNLYIDNKRCKQMKELLKDSGVCQ
jgi:hypothetical protein